MRKMKNKNRWLVVLALLASTTIWVVSKAYNPIDGWSWIGALPIEDTEYAKGYTNENYRRIVIGMSKQDVLKNLGEPLVYWTAMDDSERNRIRMSYTRSPGSTDYRRRVIVLENDRVVEIQSEYWVD